MKKLMAFIFGVSLLVCANADQLSNLVERIERLERRITILEHECAIESDRTQEEMAFEKKYAEKMSAVYNETNKRIDAFFKEYFGVCVGDGRSSLTNRNCSTYKNIVHIKSIKKFSIFDEARCVFDNDNLVGLELIAKFDVKYSTESLNRQVDISLSKLCEQFAMPVNFYRNMMPPYRASSKFFVKIEFADYSFAIRSNTFNCERGLLNRSKNSGDMDYKTYWVEITNEKMRKKINEEILKRKYSIGEQYPISK